MIDLKEFSIKELSEKFSISKDTLRYYDKEGLLIGKRLPNGYRVYDYNDVYKLSYILAMKKVGYSMEEIKFVFSRTENKTECWDELSEFVLNQKKVLQRKKKEIELMLEVIDEFGKILEHQNEEKMLNLINQIIKE